MKISDIKKDVEEILLELSDMGNTVNIKEEKLIALTSSKRYFNKISIMIRFKNPFKMSEDIVNDLIRLKSYLNDNGYKDLSFDYFDTSVKKFYIYNNSRYSRYSYSHLHIGYVPLEGTTQKSHIISSHGHIWQIWNPINSIKLIFLTDPIQESKKIKSYSLFLENNNMLIGKLNKYSIYDWIEDLKRWEWNSPVKTHVNRNSIKIWSDHFIGDGWYDKINELVEKMFNSLSKVDIDEIHMRMYDVYDELPSSKDKCVSKCITFGDIERWNESNRRKYTGLIFLSSNNNDKDKLRIIIHIIKEIVFPTIYNKGSKSLRITKESCYVTKPKWQCQNFEELLNKKAEIYSIEKIIDMYKPCINVNIGGFNDTYRTGKINLKKLESDIDETLESILPTINYEEVIFGYSRFDRKFDDNTDIYDYSFKILLKY